MYRYTITIFEDEYNRIRWRDIYCTSDKFFDTIADAKKDCLEFYKAEGCIEPYIEYDIK